MADFNGTRTLDGAASAECLEHALGRRDLFRVAGAMGTTTGAGALLSAAAPARADAAPRNPVRNRSEQILQPGKGRISGDHYLRSDADEVLWGYVPTTHAEPVVSMRSGQTITVDTVSHEGILEDQGRDPVAFFRGKCVSRDKVLADAVTIASSYRRTTRDFDVDGPHVVTGPIRVRGAEPGDVLKIETLEALPRVPYGVVSSRHGKGALGRKADGSAPDGISLAEVMPPTATDGRSTGDPTRYGNVSTFASVENGRAVMRHRGGKVSFPLNCFMGIMGVAYSDADGLTSPNASSIPPTLGGGNIDIRLLGVGSTFYLPVFADGALFYVGDPHMAMGDGEVALTAMEGSLRATFRLTVVKKGSKKAPSPAFEYPFAETRDAWIPIGLSDPDGAAGGQGSDLDIAMRRAVLNALDFLEHDRSTDRATAYAYLSAASNFIVSQVVDRTVGVHGQIFKSHFV